MAALLTSYNVLLMLALVVLGVALYLFIDNRQKLANQELKNQDEKLMIDASEVVKAVALSAAPSQLEVKENFTLDQDPEEDQGQGPEEEGQDLEEEEKEPIELEGFSSSSVPAPFINL
jgi:hypothetical protein